MQPETQSGARAALEAAGWATVQLWHTCQITQAVVYRLRAQRGGVVLGDSVSVGLLELRAAQWPGGVVASAVERGWRRMLAAAGR